MTTHLPSPQGDAVVAPGVDDVLVDVADLLSNRALDAGDDPTQCVLDAAFDRLLLRVEAARRGP